jgi:tetratricopeptide (TPR) repeat protein
MKKNRVVFLRIPESLRERLSCGTDIFQINPDIPIPAEIPENNEKDCLENLSLDMILSGMLRVIEEGEAAKEWIDYYSAFIIFLRPGIMAKLKEIKSAGLGASDFESAGLNDESFLKAHSLIREGNAQEGLSRVRDFLERYPRVWNGWFLLGWALRLLGRWQDGEAAFRKTIELGGCNSDTRNELAICLMEAGDMAGARHELETALNEDPENVKIISNMGALALKYGKKEDASAFFRTALEIDKDDPIAKKFLEKI